MIGLNPQRYLNNPIQIEIAAKKMISLGFPIPLKSHCLTLVNEKEGKFFQISEPYPQIKDGNIEFRVDQYKGLIGALSYLSEPQLFSTKKESECFREEKIIELTGKKYFKII